MKPPDLLVTEEGVRHPHFARVRHRQVFYLTLFRIGIRHFYFSKIVESFLFHPKLGKVLKSNFGQNKTQIGAGRQKSGLEWPELAWPQPNLEN